MDQQTPGGIISPTNGPSNQPVPSNPTQEVSSAPVTPHPATSADNSSVISPQYNSQTTLSQSPNTPQSFAAQYSPPPLPKAGKIPKKKLSTLVIAAIAVLVIGGGSAAAYYGFIVPSKPENKLLSALADLAGQKELVTDGTVDVTSSNLNLSFALNYKAEANLEKNQLGLSGTIGYSGTQFPYEVRYVDKNVYAKVGGLDGLDKIKNAESGQVIDYLKAVSSINDKWYVVDRSYWQSMGSEASCVTDISFALSKDDITMLKSAYQKHPLFKVKSTTTAKVGNDDTTKYDVEPASDAEAAAFAKELTGLSAVKKANECLKSSGSSSSVDQQLNDISKASTATGTMAFYVGNDKKIKKLELSSTDNGTTVKIAANFTYQSVNVAVPEGAKPIQELLGGLFGGGFEDSPLINDSVTSKARDTERETDIKAMHGQIEAYYAQYGYYPTLTDLNSDAFRTSKLKGLDKEALKDPQGSGFTLVASPEKNAYAYAVSPAGCNNTGTKLCATYTLTATLEAALNGVSTYTKNSLN